jgi:hypothetical protein
MAKRNGGSLPRNGRTSLTRSLILIWIISNVMRRSFLRKYLFNKQERGEIVSKEDTCKLHWCNSEALKDRYFCRYHQSKLSPEIKPLVKTAYTSTEAIKRGLDYLIKEHETLVDCHRCKGRGVNMGHSSYLRGKTCSWCDKGKKAKIY